jgi:hypothetical protein
MSNRMFIEGMTINGQPVPDPCKCVTCFGSGADADGAECLDCEGAGEYICEECAEPYDRAKVYGERSCLSCAYWASH